MILAACLSGPLCLGADGYVEGAGATFGREDGQRATVGFRRPAGKLLKVFLARKRESDGRSLRQPFLFDVVAGHYG